ncbi:M23 family metallopeptidase [Sphingomonas sp.]|uniref:M23 family metallopeptidase n=1 Tax=Sphingomonas sp. TaxID=28214 RepID=UPI003AFF839A
MAKGEDEGTSFDPKTWGGAPSPKAPVPSASPPPSNLPADQTSFDPKSWGTTADAAPVAPPPPPIAAAPPSSPPPAMRRPPYLLATGLSAVLLTGGAVAAHLSHATAPATAQAAPAAGIASTVAAPPPVEAVNASRRTLVIASPADVATTLTSTGIPAGAATAAARAAASALGSAAGDIRMMIDLVGPDDARRMTRLEATRDDGSGVVLTVKPDGSYASAVQQARLTTEVQVVRGEMDSNSFYSAAVTAGITDSLIETFAKAFAFDFNFATDVHSGDIFEAAFEQKVNPQGDRVGPPVLIYVSLQTQAKSKSLYRFLAPGDTEPGWYDGNGRSTVTALMRTPVDGARISSGFGMRFHPVLHFNKLHKGTDFAAPIGTPIYAAGNGVIQWAAMKGPNGNLTILQHDNGWQTYYLHQSMFMPGVVPGARVSQGQKIGEIGTTGRSTGPHLHFELHVDGQPIDPMSVDTGTGKVLGGDALTGFRKERDRIDRSRAAPVS